jgi:ribosomal protein S18 acetylase RimI-like enzyme
MYLPASADDHDEINGAQAVGFQFVDTRLGFARQTAPCGPASRVRLYRAADLQRLRAIARTSHEVTRFFADPHFPREGCRDLYDRWIVRSCEEGWADAVFVVDVDGYASGYVTCHLDGAARRGSIGLTAVSAASRGAGLGRDLVCGALAWFDERGCEEVSIVTQGANVGAQRLFQACGFRTASAGIWLHRWYER